MPEVEKERLKGHLPQLKQGEVFFVKNLFDYRVFINYFPLVMQQIEYNEGDNERREDKVSDMPQVGAFKGESRQSRGDSLVE